MIKALVLPVLSRGLANGFPTRQGPLTGNMGAGQGAHGKRIWLWWLQSATHALTA